MCSASVRPPGGEVAREEEVRADRGSRAGNKAEPDPAGGLRALPTNCIQLSFSKHCFAGFVIVFFLPSTLFAHQCLLFPCL